MSGRTGRYVTAVWIAGILVTSLLPPELGAREGTVWHIVGYAGLTWLLRAWQTAARAAVLAWGYGALIEGLQALTTYRAAEADDLLANAGGVVVGLLLSSVLRRWRS